MTNKNDQPHGASLAQLGEQATAPTDLPGSASGQHSPLPWRSVEHEGLRDADGEWIARTDGDDSFAPLQTDAEFICRAVNNHDALVAALKEVLEYMPSVTAFQRERIRRAEAALAKAEAK